ncbi:MAG TPA: GTPase [Planctomycetes bacterium]|nr:GTPase [Planctomycetota bacterium]
MVQINFALKEVNCKIVFYGPGMSGKTTNLEVVHQKAPEENKGDLTSISTDGDRTLFFDFMPLDLGKIAGMQTKFQLYTVPGQVYYNSTRKLVLQGVDGVIFVADSDPDKMAENIESYENLNENLIEYGKDLQDLPHVIQYNKRDLPNALPVEEIDRQLNRFGVPTFEAVAKTGEGVFPTLKTLAGMVLESINKSERGGGRGPSRAARPTAAPAHQEPAPQGAPAPKATPTGRAPAPAARQARSSAPRGAAPASPKPAARRGGNQRPAPRVAVQANAPAKKEGKGFLVAFLVLLMAAVAGVAYLVMQQQGF